VPVLPKPLDVLERRFRRRFIETHELLGRGKVLTAFDRGDEAYLDHIVALRLRMINRKLMKSQASIHIDISKYFARGLHRAFARALPGLSLIRLLRDPVLNMRSYLNRNKNFLLDNNLPDAQSNILRFNSVNMEKGELYLWAWCEMYLRFDRLVEEFKIERAVEIRTEHLTDAARMNAALDALGLPHTPVVPAAPVNTNAEHGYGRTRILQGDLDLFERFLKRLPADVRRRITYFETYQPGQSATLVTAGLRK